MTFASSTIQLTPAMVTVDWDKRTAKIHFGAKPEESVRKALKEAGFRFQEGQWTGAMKALPKAHLAGAALRVLIPAGWYAAIRSRTLSDAEAAVKASLAWADQFGWEGPFVAKASEHVDYTWVRFEREEAEAVMAAAARLTSVPAREIDSVTDYDMISR